MIRAAVLGSPISHSLSPALHAAAYKKLGIAAEYLAFEVKEDALVDFISNLEGEWSGFSLTMPLKEKVLSVATAIDPVAGRISSANTLIPRGRDWFATSTDRTGFISLMASHKLTQAKRIAFLGAGGTARAAIAASDFDGVSFSIFRRTSVRDSLASASAQHAGISFCEWRPTDFAGFDCVINTVPGNASAEILLPHDQLPPLIDVIYNPWPSPLAQRWLAVQPRVISGIELLIWQGIDQIELMSGAEFNREEMFNHLFHTLVTVV